MADPVEQRVRVARHRDHDRAVLGAALGQQLDRGVGVDQHALARAQRAAGPRERAPGGGPGRRRGLGVGLEQQQLDVAAGRLLAEHPCGDDPRVVNDTRVIPARVLGNKETGGAVELLFLEPDPAPPAPAGTPPGAASRARAARCARASASRSCRRRRSSS